MSEMKLHEIIGKIELFSPIKITFNNLELYNDYDSTQLQESIAGYYYYGEILPSIKVVPERISSYRNSIVESIEIEFTEFHHSIVRIKGKYIEE